MFSSQNGKTLKSQVDFFKGKTLSSWCYHNDITFFFQLHCIGIEIFTKTGPLFQVFVALNVFFSLLNFSSEARNDAPLTAFL